MSARNVAATGATQIMGATVIAGIAGYVVTWLVYRVVGPAPYALFAVFWAALYLVIGALSGIQQEITRATRAIPPGSRTGASRSREFAMVAGSITLIAVVASAPLWVDRVFPVEGWALVWPLAIGAASYVLVATLSGSLYGVSQWRSLALMISVDGVLRLALVGVILATTHDIVALAWAAALPFPLTIVVLWTFIRRTFVGRSDIDVGLRGLTWNVARTVLASVSTAVLVSAFPLLLGVTSGDTDAALVGELVFTLTLTRAPLVVTVMALQSYLIVQFRARSGTWARLFAAVLGVIAVGGGILALAGWWLGPIAFDLVSASPVTVGGGFIAVMVASSALIGALSVSGSAVLARDQHLVYSAGWVVAAIVTVVVMFLPGVELHARIVLAAVIAPIVGLIVHGGWLALRRGAPREGKDRA